MYQSLRLRSQQSISDIIDVLEEMALVDTRGHRALTTPDIYSYSTASTPSLRAREAMPATIESTVGDSDGGNVKVVVRVRKFVKRGMKPSQRAAI